MILHLRITLLDTDPVIWRTVAVDEGRTLYHLHRIQQIVFGWADNHMFLFEVGNLRFGEGEVPEWLDEEEHWQEAADVTLWELKLRKGDGFLYTYDFGDDWQVQIDVERRRQGAVRGGANLPWLLAGERAGPPEDCGGTHGLARLIEALSGPPPTASDSDRWDLEGLEDDAEDEEERERRELLEWVGDYDPAAFDRWTVNQFLGLASAWGALDP